MINNIATFIGGLQALTGSYKIHKQPFTKDTKVFVSDIKLYDTFGAGFNDGSEVDKSKWSERLVSMFILQHFRNANNVYLYQPYVVVVEVE
ncbi:hypothetical protein [Zooshikella sp. RANM57]|uniref:hypothetical protein n=1 Tax=Zooshikella sp. RANM57 TaxID=3425863 RepID=UPI003D6EDF47